MMAGRRRVTGRPGKRRSTTCSLERTVRAGRSFLSRPPRQRPISPPAPGRRAGAADARAAVDALLPKPWPVDRRAALARLEALSLPAASSAIWLSDGLADGGADDELAAYLSKRASLRYLAAP